MRLHNSNVPTAARSSRYASAPSTPPHPLGPSPSRYSLCHIQPYVLSPSLTFSRSPSLSPSLFPGHLGVSPRGHNTHQHRQRQRDERKSRVVCAQAAGQRRRVCLCSSSRRSKSPAFKFTSTSLYEWTIARGALFVYALPVQGIRYGTWRMVSFKHLQYMYALHVTFYYSCDTRYLLHFISYCMY